jgi:hypothetical protein
MTEAEWASCRSPDDLLGLIPRPEARKLVLFAAACRRLSWAHLEEEFRAEVEVQERYADGLATAADVVHAREVYGGEGSASSPEPDVLLWAAGNAEETAEDGAYWIAGNTPDVPDRAKDPWHIAHDRLLAAQCDLLRDIFRSPFRGRVLAPGRLTHSVADLARAAYEQRIGPSGTLDPVRLAILADALEEAGCTEADLVKHLRSSGPHVRGCWALDLCLEMK